ncbi:MAG: germination protein YpeB [Oscillospiraceae bacterium]|nr:germination protein YpeB [Oscillospiraceae bacterium]
MKRKTAILTVSYLSAVIFMLGLFTTLQLSAVAASERSERYGEEYAFEELCAAMEAMDLALQKCALATTPGLQAALCSDVYALTGSAVTALGELPGSHELEKLTAFLGRTGDFTRCLGRCAASGALWSEEERAMLDKLAAYSADAAADIAALRADIADGIAEAADTREALRALETELPAVPEPVCEGRFSPSQSDAALLEGKSKCSEREACLIAASFLGENARNAASQGLSEAEEPCWSVEVGDYSVAVTERGGQVLHCVCRRPVEKPRLTLEEGFAAAEDFLREQGYKNMERTGWRSTGDTLTVSVCPLQQDVRCYADGITLSIALDDGTLLAFDAADYVENHRPRQPEPPLAAWEDARGLLSGTLTVEEEYLSYLPLDGGGEKLCFTFRCVDESGRRWLVFSSAATGAQERIVRILERETGVETV